MTHKLIQGAKLRVEAAKASLGIARWSPPLVRMRMDREPPPRTSTGRNADGVSGDAAAAGGFLGWSLRFQ